MRYQVDPPLRIGKRQVAVISRIQTGHRRFGRTSVFQGKKWPEFIIIKDKEGMIAAFDPSGARVAWADIECTCPDAAAAAIEVL